MAQNRFDPSSGSWVNDSIPIASSSVLSSYTPVAGDVVYCDPADGKFKPADNSSAVKVNILGAVLGPLPGGALAQGSGFLLQMCGTQVPLSLFLPGATAAAQLASLQGLGAVSDCWVGSASTPGRIGAAPGPGIGLFARKVFSIPKRFSDLTAADLTSLYVVLATGSPAAV